jgi:hypothetical protein
MSASVCTVQTLTTYLSTAPFTCTESPLTYGFLNTLLPSYVGLNILSNNNSAASTGSITVNPSSSPNGLLFTSSAFTEAGGLLGVLGAQTELVQFTVASSGGAITDTDFSLDNPVVTGGVLNAGVGLALGQELVCVGGTFTSLPTGLITSVANGLLGTGTFGCNGAVLIGTVAADAGTLSDVTSLLGLPSLVGVTDSADIQLAPYNPTFIDVIKIQTLLGALGGTASTTGFGDTFSAAAATPAPEPATLGTLFGGLLLICGGLLSRQNRGKRMTTAIRRWSHGGMA